MTLQGKNLKHNYKTTWQKEWKIIMRVWNNKNKIKNKNKNKNRKNNYILIEKKTKSKKNKINKIGILIHIKLMKKIINMKNR